jgi:hypothetical protein
MIFVPMISTATEDIKKTNIAESVLPFTSISIMDMGGYAVERCLLK